MTANTAWTAKSDSTWLTVGTASGSGNGSSKVTAASNTSGAARTGRVTFTCGNVSKVYTLTQDKYSISVSPTSQSGVPATGGSYTVTVTSSAGWTASSNASWLTVSAASGSSGAKPTVKAAANTTTSSRSGKITFTCGNVPVTYTLTQNGQTPTPTPAPAINPGLTSLTASRYAITKTVEWKKYYDLYTTSDLTTKLGSDRWTGEDDTIWIMGAGVNSRGTRYVYVKYPAGSDTPNTNAYMPLSAFVTGSLTSSKKATQRVIGEFTEWIGGTYFPSSWEIYSGDTVYLLDHVSGWWQIMYPAGSVFRIVWCTDATYNKLFSGSTPTPTPTTYQPMSKGEFMRAVAALAVADYPNSRILPSVVTAQAIIETGWGQSEIMMRSNALFGVKATSSWTGGFYSTSTNEYYGEWTTVTALFRAYDSWEACLADHTDILRQSRYAGVIGGTNYVTVCELLQSGGYATDPEYASKLISIITANDLTDYDNQVR